MRNRVNCGRLRWLNNYFQNQRKGSEVDYKELGITDEQYEKLKVISEGMSAMYGKNTTSVEDLLQIAFKDLGDSKKRLMGLIKLGYKHFSKKHKHFHKMRVGGKRF